MPSWPRPGGEEPGGEFGEFDGPVVERLPCRAGGQGFVSAKP